MQQDRTLNVVFILYQPPLFQRDFELIKTIFELIKNRLNILAEIIKISQK